MTPVEELRLAAARIRQIAEAATPGPWVNLNRGDRIVRMVGLVGGVDYVVDEPLYANPDNGAHIALWHPGTAGLIADLLDDVARSWLDRDDEAELFGSLTVAKLARAINGGAL